MEITKQGSFSFVLSFWLISMTFWKIFKFLLKSFHVMLLMKFDLFCKKLLPPSSFSLLVVTKDCDLIHDIYRVCVCVCVRAHALSPVPLFATSRTVAHQAPLPVGFPRQKYWGGLSFPLWGGLSDLGIKPTSALAARFFTPEPPLTQSLPSLVTWTN